LPVEFSVGEAITLLEHGKFTLLSFDGSIPSAKATTIFSTPMPVNSEAVKTVYEIAKRPDWGVLTERFNWGETSRPGKVYYELWSWGKPFGIPTPYGEGFYSGSKIKASQIDNISPHIFAANSIEVKLWNCSSPAEAVYYEFTVWYYTYLLERHEKVMEILLKTPNTLEAILGELQNLSKVLMAPELARLG